MNFIHKHWRKILASTMLSFLLIAGSLIVWAGSEIASPPRRALMDYHREYLTKPSNHGIQIDSFVASDGTPCLVVSPSGTLAMRGTIIRKQLAEKGIGLADFGTIQGTLVLIHGRKGRKEDYLPIAERFCACGFRCIIPDLPAHGDHPLKTATYGINEGGLPARVLAESARKFGFAGQPAGLMGLSMGGSVAIHSAAEPNAPWKTLVIVASFDALSRVIDGQAKRYIGSTLGQIGLKASSTIFTHKTAIPLSAITPAKLAKTLHIPTLVAHGTADTVIPIASGRRLFDALPANIPKRWLEIPQAGHDDVLVTDYPIYAELAAWLLLHMGNH